jgi:hypothetical protein
MRQTTYARPRGIRCHESAAKKGRDIEGQKGIDCASALRKLAVDLKGRSAHTSVPKAAFMPALFDGPICGPHRGLHGFQNPHA